MTQPFRTLNLLTIKVRNGICTHLPSVFRQLPLFVNVQEDSSTLFTLILRWLSCLSMFGHYEEQLEEIPVPKRWLEPFPFLQAPCSPAVSPNFRVNRSPTFGTGYKEEDHGQHK